MKIRFHLIGLIISVALITGCDNIGNPGGFDYGKVEKNKYINSFFDFEMSIPEGWSVQSREQSENIAQMGKEFVAGGNDNLKAVLNASEINSANLLTVFKHDIKTAVKFNPSFSLIAENMKSNPEIKTGADYLTLTRNFLKQSQIQLEKIDDVFKKEVVDGKEFYRMNTTLNYNGFKIQQAYYSSIQNGFSLVVTISYVENSEGEELKNVVHSMVFKN